MFDMIETNKSSVLKTFARARPAKIFAACAALVISVTISPNADFAQAASGNDTPNEDTLPTRASDHKTELDEISRRMREARRRWLDKTIPGIARSGITDPTSTITTSGEATVLLVMKPGNRGIRRFSKTADPILCVDYHCYVSRGADMASRKLRRRKAFGVINTLGRRAGACSGRTHCIFRNVDLGGSESVIQPVDLRMIHHDRRAPRHVAIDHTCRMSLGHLKCSGGLHTADYTAWIVSEDIAARIGSATLVQALWRDLPSPSSTSALAD